MGHRCYTDAEADAERHRELLPPGLALGGFFLPSPAESAHGAAGLGQDRGDLLP